MLNKGQYHVQMELTVNYCQELETYSGFIYRLTWYLKCASMKSDLFK